MRFFPTLTRDDRGVAAIELALAAPLLATLVIGTVDLSNAYSRKLQLEQAAQRGVEKIMQTTEGDTVDTTVVDEIKAIAGSTATVTMTTRLECNQVVKPDFNTQCAANEYEARYILVNVSDEFAPQFPVTFGANANGKYPINVKVGMRTQ
jgi:Flp pilus assembly protein TadG